MKTAGMLGVPSPALSDGGTSWRSSTSTMATAPAAPALAVLRLASQVPRSTRTIGLMVGSKLAKFDGSQPWLAGAPDGPIGPAGTVSGPSSRAVGAADHVCGTAYLTVLSMSPSIVGDNTCTGSSDASGSAVSATAIDSGATA